MAQGLTGFFAGRPGVQPVMQLFSFLWPKAKVMPRISIGGATFDVPFGTAFHHLPQQGRGGAPALAAAPSQPGMADARAPLIALAVGRSGDKGNAANIGILARRADYLPWLCAALTPDAVQEFFSHTGVTRVDRYDLPGLNALNFVLHNALGGGGVASLRIDPQGKAFAQMLMDFPVDVPRALADQLAMANQ
jgi:hypothetical protein